ncbi:MAG: flagellar biosynthesis repressor FlbT [Opitutales bacterium]|nr:flagellar biosynthesis repressor FlbT [Opitutales bacterium]
MALKLKLKPNERVYISGALVRNIGPGAVLELMNEVPMLREKDILLEQDAVTPCQKLYLIVQTLYFDCPGEGILFESFKSLSEEIVAAAPSLEKPLWQVGEKVQAGEHYPALKDLQKVITLESTLLSYAKKSY